MACLIVLPSFYACTEFAKIFHQRIQPPLEDDALPTIVVGKRQFALAATADHAPYFEQCIVLNNVQQTAALFALMHVKKDQLTEAQRRKLDQLFLASKPIAIPAPYMKRLIFDKSEPAEKDECCICRDCAKTVMLAPCQHQVMCDRCCVKIMRTSKECPVCRSEIEDVYRPRVI